MFNPSIYVKYSLSSIDRLNFFIMSGLNDWLNRNMGNIINAGSQVASSAIGAVSSGKMNQKALKNAREQREWSEKMMNQQNAWSVDMYNQFYSPDAERRQKLEAGINPLYDDGAISAMPASSTANQYQLPNLQNPFEGALSALAAIAGIKNTEADTDLKNAETDSKYKLTKAEISKIDANIDEIRATIDNLKSSTALNETEKERLDILNKWLDKEKDAELNKIVSETKLNEALKEKSEYEKDTIIYNLKYLLPIDRLLKEKDLKKQDALIDEIFASIDKIKKETDLTDLDIFNYAWNHSSNTYKSAKSFLPDLVPDIGADGKPVGDDGFIDFKEFPSKFNNRLDKLKSDAFIGVIKMFDRIADRIPSL